MPANTLHFPPGFRRNTGRVHAADLDGPCDLVAANERDVAHGANLRGWELVPSEKTLRLPRSRSVFAPDVWKKFACFFSTNQSQVCFVTERASSSFERHSLRLRFARCIHGGSYWYAREHRSVETDPKR